MQLQGGSDAIVDITNIVAAFSDAVHNLILRALILFIYLIGTKTLIVF